MAIALIVGAEWGKLRQQTKDKWAFLWIIAIGWILAIVLIVKTGLPGPTQFIESVYKPLGELLKPPPS
ncbi:hypothetical protein [Paenibacillus sp. FSL H8-0034]|uniref:hypothetical protein n=1 Tax=Paenibacillus sp. FSL H8-0034 TaxID=2954671 RepID=UPI0030FB6F55